MPRHIEESRSCDQSLWLSKEEKEDPYSVLENFFYDHSLTDLRGFLSDVSETCLTTDDYPFCMAQKRADLLLYKKKIAHFFEAASVIVKQRQDARVSNVEQL